MELDSLLMLFMLPSSLAVLNDDNGGLSYANWSLTPFGCGSKSRNVADHLVYSLLVINVEWNLTILLIL